MRNSVPFGVAAVAVTLALAVSSAPASAAPIGGAAPAAPVAAVPTDSVVLERSGGLAGITERFTVNRETANRQAVMVLDLTAESRFRTLRRQYLPADPCCDRFRYDLVVRYRDGRVKAVTTVDGTLATPGVLTDVIRLTAEAGAPVT